MTTKNRRWITPVIIILSAAIFAFSAFAASGNLSAYNTFKNSLIETMTDTTVMEENNFTKTTTFNVRYDDEQILSARSVHKQEALRVSNSSTVYETSDGSFGSESWTWLEGDAFHNVQKGADDVYYRTQVPYVMTSTSEASSYTYTPEPPTSSEIQFFDALIDTVMGDTKNFFTTDGDAIVLNLEGSQIPELIQLGLNMAVESAGKDLKEDKHIPNSIVEKLTSLKNLRLDDIYVSMPANSSPSAWISDATFKFTLSGQDANGIRHTIAADGSMATENVGSTVSDKVDLTGKNVVDLENNQDIGLTVTEHGGIGFTVVTVEENDRED